ncbi:MAG: ribosome silencing factor [bacterium]|nr:ribosome silencing factor [bacterium]
MSSTENTAAAVQPEPVEIPDSPEQVRLAVAAAQSRKAEELQVLHLGEVSDFTDYFLICNGTNERQVRAIADTVIGRLREAKVRALHVEGYNHGHWILLDYGGDMVIHIFLDETRQFYRLERLWADAPEVTAEFS